MGIQGLLPMLKPIQRTRHLSEFAGQTLAVDAYVWLHKGAFACAAELVQGRPTRRYVDYCMARVRLLRHYGIEPYLVFDGGPLPAKLGTEKEREKRREQNIRRANELKAEGKESQATELYVKCVDVTPQMAYQVIKALKVEKVQYVVSPYEADAQLAYLERVGLVDGIITEDSDLLVFGCRNVHVKLDTVAATVVSICRADFGSPALAASSFSLIGWSEAQFRWMAMLSGCDYLPSIAGVGLKTAYQLLKKYKAVDKVVKMIRLEGKKSVPKNYLDLFYLAEKVFLHQRVYDPLSKRLVYLAIPSHDLILDEAAELYIGRDLDPSLASRIAVGDVCPISLKDMEDINPTFVPKGTKLTNGLPLHDRSTNVPKAPKEKTHSKTGGILSFLKPVNKPTTTKAQSPTRGKDKQPRIVAGTASGKRTLVDVMEEDIASKRKKFSRENETGRSRKSFSASHFFSKPSSLHGSSAEGVAEKENIEPPTNVEAEIPELDDPVTQEDGYLSPSPSFSRAVTPDVSSPIASCKQVMQGYVEVLDEPLSERSLMPENEERILVRESSEPLPDYDDKIIPGPDLAKNMVDDDSDQGDDRLSEASSEILCWEDEDVSPGTETSGTSRVRSGTPKLQKLARKDSATGSIMTRTFSFDDPTDELDLLEIDEEEFWEKQQHVVQARLAEKWRQSYSLGGRQAIRRSATTFAGEGDSSCPMKTPQHRTLRQHSSQPKQAATSHPVINQRSVRLKSDSKTQTARRNVHASVGTGTTREGSRTKPILVDDDGDSNGVSNGCKTRLQAFRFSA